MNTNEVGIKLKQNIGLTYFPIGITFADHLPEKSKRFSKKGEGCIVPLIFSSAKGQTVSIDKDSTGWPCSAFYLGYKDWIFEGIECFLTDGLILGRIGERFIKTRKQAKEFVSYFVPVQINNKVTIIKPLEQFKDYETPELVVFFATPDELSGLIFLLHFNSPLADDLVITGFNSGCGSIFTKPMKLISEGKKKAVLGMQDISARLRLPKEIMSLTLPYSMVIDIVNEIDSSFIKTENWEKIKMRQG
jgi:uncharacterized protein (DUF169 family)